MNITPKTYYATYRADGIISPLAEAMMTLINQDRCVHAFEMGCGEGKHLRRLRAKGVSTMGMDISILNCFTAQAQSDGIILGDENYLRHLVNFDCTFTVSVLDHIQDVDGIIQELKRITNKVVYLLETNDIPGEFYFAHEYEKYGFEKVHGLFWTSEKPEGDGATYYLWRWYKHSEKMNGIHDDLA